MGKLAILETSIPIKAIPEEELNKVILTSFLTWLCDLLSLTDETSAKRLKIALPAIKVHCWSMGFEEIKKMFTIYADGGLSVKPMPNYFDRILLGKIVDAYKQQKPIIKKEIVMPEPTQEEKDNLIYMGVINCFDEFKQTNKIIEGYVWVYDHLDELQLLKYTADEKKKVMILAKDRLIKENKEYMSLDQYKKFTFDLENKRANQSIINMAKKMLLERYFNNLIAKNTHIKTVCV